MRGILLFIVAAAISAAALAPTAANAMTAVDPAVTAAGVLPIETAGCYRLGETGYHWYAFCVGPRWLYPHRRICHHRYCHYR